MMNLRRVSLSLLVQFCFHLAIANAAGVNLAWDACPPEGGVQNKVFACNTNNGTRTLYGSFALANAHANLTGVEITIDIQAASDSLPGWWQFFNLNSCRKTSLSSAFTFDAVPGTACADLWADQATGSIASYRTYWTTPKVPAGVPNSAQLKIVAAVPNNSPISVASGTEYYCFAASINSAKTAGTGTCSGCSAPVCITLSEIRAVQSDGSAEILQQPLTSNIVTWQSYSNCVSPASTHNMLWGSIRSQYR